MPDESPDMFETTAMPPLPPGPVLPARLRDAGRTRRRPGWASCNKVRDRETGEVLAIQDAQARETASDTQILERFKTNCGSPTRSRIANVARLYEFHREGKSVYLSMEFVEGESLRALIERSGKLPIPRILDPRAAACERPRRRPTGISIAHTAT
jgi:serine/threonine protein kinase